MKYFNKFRVGTIAACLACLMVGFFTAAELTGCADQSNGRSAVSNDASNIVIDDGNDTAQIEQALKQSQPLPLTRLSTYSQERFNLINKLLLWNQPNAISYIVLINQGKVFRYCTVKGKVSSNNSLLTNPQQLVNPGSWNGRDSADYLAVASPDLDGSYGDNPQGIFFWTTSGEYVEWGGQGAIYMLSTRPLNLTTPPDITLSVKG